MKKRVVHYSKFRHDCPYVYFQGEDFFKFAESSTYKERVTCKWCLKKLGKIKDECKCGNFTAFGGTPLTCLKCGKPTPTLEGKTKKIVLNFADFKRETLEFLVKRSCETHIPVDDIIRTALAEMVGLKK